MIKQQRQSSLSNEILKDNAEKKQIELFNQMLKKNTSEVKLQKLQ